MDIIIVIVIVCICISISVSVSVGVVFATSTTTNTTTTKAPTTTTKAPTTKAPTTPPPDCPDNYGIGVGKAGITKVDKECMLGPNYTGKMIYMCTAQGQWIVDNKCVSTGSADLVDISGDWNMMYAGNFGTATITKVNDNNWNVVTSGDNGPGKQLPREVTRIKYVSGEGYYYNNNQASKFKDSTYKKLDGGNYYFERT